MTHTTYAATMTICSNMSDMLHHMTRLLQDMRTYPLKCVFPTNHMNTKTKLFLQN